MSSLPVSKGRGVLGALICLSFGLLCASAAPVSAIEFETLQTPIFEQNPGFGQDGATEGALEARFVPSIDRNETIPLDPDGKWNIGFDNYAAPSFAQTDIRETQIVLDNRTSWLTGARAQISGHSLFLIDDKLSLSLGVPLQVTAGRVPILNNVFVQNKRHMRVKDLVLSLVNEKMWSVAAAHKLPIAYKPLKFGYGVYAQFRGSELRHVGLGFSGRLSF